VREPAVAPESPPVAPDVIAELERLRTETEQALEAQDFERAAKLRDRERRILSGARRLTRAWKDQPDPSPAAVARAVPIPAHGALRRHARGDERRRTWQTEAVVAGWAMFGAAAALGVLLGWLVWG
jgi:UvrB/uvrC motif